MAEHFFSHHRHYVRRNGKSNADKSIKWEPQIKSTFSWADHNRLRVYGGGKLPLFKKSHVARPLKFNAQTHVNGRAFRNFTIIVSNTKALL